MFKHFVYFRAWSRARQLRGRIPGLASWAACSAAVVLFAIQGGGHATVLNKFSTDTCIQYNLPPFCDLANHSRSTVEKQTSTVRSMYLVLPDMPAQYVYNEGYTMEKNLVVHNMMQLGCSHAVLRDEVRV